MRPSTLLAGFLAAILPAVVSLSDNPGRFTAVPSPSDPASTWFLDTATGSLARCVAPTFDRPPACSPATQGVRQDPHMRAMVPTAP